MSTVRRPNSALLVQIPARKGDAQARRPESEGHGFKSKYKQNIFSLCGDYSENGNSKSSFEKEMSEMDFILKNLSSNSLILIDELCRSTNYYEGLSLAIAICEYMMFKINDFQSDDNQNITILFATHFKELAYFDYLYPKIRTFQMKSIEDIKLNKDINV